MKRVKQSWIIVAVFIIIRVNIDVQALVNDPNYDDEGCTIGVASGKATSDGRPLLWKTRDTSSSPDNMVFYHTTDKYKFISVIGAGYELSSWMGVNEKGFAILNSYSGDLPSGDSGPGNGSLMCIALGTCATVADFEHLLDSTNVTGRKTQANFGVIDSTGAAKIIETCNDWYWIFDANNTLQSPNGYILRTNFAVNGNGDSGIERYYRTDKLVGDFHAGDSLNHRSILRHQMRDFSDFYSDPISVPYAAQWLPSRPYGYIYAYVSICRSTTVSNTVIQGVLPGESAKLSTMWTILGHPAATVALPYWPIGETPIASNSNPSAPLCDKAIQIQSTLFDYTENLNYIDSYKLRDASGDGLWAMTFPAEDSVFSATEVLMSRWRTDGIDIDEMLASESSFTTYASSILEMAYHALITTIPEDIVSSGPDVLGLYQNFPNPFNHSTTIQFTLPQPETMVLTIYNLLGKELFTLIEERREQGIHVLEWDAGDLPSGIYLLRLIAGEYIETRKLILER